jgi:hypothetical protein
LGSDSRDPLIFSDSPEYRKRSDSMAMQSFRQKAEPKERASQTMLPNRNIVDCNAPYHDAYSSLGQAQGTLVCGAWLG